MVVCLVNRQRIRSLEDANGLLQTVQRRAVNPFSLFRDDLQFSRIPVQVDGDYLYRIASRRDIWLSLTEQTKDHEQNVRLPIKAGTGVFSFGIRSSEQGKIVVVTNEESRCQLLLKQETGDLSVGNVSTMTSRLPALVLETDTLNLKITE